MLSCLSGDSLHTVKVFQIIEDNYTKPLQRLVERYDKKCLIFVESIEENKTNASLPCKAVDTV